MSRNNFFSPSRFVRLILNDWLIHKKLYMLTLIGLLIGIYSVSYGWMRVAKWHFGDGYFLSVLLVFFVAIPVFIGNAFPGLRDQIKTSNYLLLPGSAFEKLMVQFVVRVLLFVPLTLGFLSLGNHLAKATISADIAKEVHLNFNPNTKNIKVDDHVIGKYENIKINFNRNSIPDFSIKETFEKMNFFMNPFYDLGDDSWNILIFILFLFSFAIFLFAGAVYFKNLPLIKSLVSMAILFGLFILTLGLSQYFLFPEGPKQVVVDATNPGSVNRNITLFFYVISIITCPVFLFFTYFRLKEKEA